MNTEDDLIRGRNVLFCLNFEYWLAQTFSLAYMLLFYYYFW